MGVHQHRLLRCNTGFWQLNSEVSLQSSRVVCGFATWQNFSLSVLTSSVFLQSMKLTLDS